MTLIAAYCVTSTLSALQVATSLLVGSFEGQSIERGETLEVLEWMTFGFSVLFSGCVDFMLHSSGDVVVEQRAGLGECHSAAVAYEQRLADLFLELGDGSA